MESSQLDATDAKVDAQSAFDKAMEAKNTSESARDNLQRLIEQITDFLNEEVAEPADIRMVSNKLIVNS